MNTLSGKPLSKIGIGSYGIGGRGHRDMPITEKQEDEVYVDALVYSLSKNINFIEIAVGYGHGQSLGLFKQALDKGLIDRRDIFITHSLYPRDLASIKTIQEDIDTFHRVLQTDYADSTLVTQSLILKFGERDVYSLLNELLDEGKTRYVSLSNASPTWITKFKEEFKDKFVAHEGHISFEVRALQDKGVFSLCDKLNVANIIWRPLRRNKSAERNWDLLAGLATKYEKTQNQIILNWMCAYGFHPMVMSSSNKHTNENVESTNFVMSDEDYKKINEFRPINFTSPSIDWEGSNIDGDIVGLANDIEKYLE
ncbi:MAG: aldo/keto reductase [Candidatus Nanoarchaeia archaeon]